MKTSRRLPLGPVALFFRLVRRVPVSGNTRRRWWSLLSRQRLAPAGAADDGSRPVPAAAAVGVNIGLAGLACERRVETALIVGVGPGLGHALARTLAAAGMQVALASRNAERLHPLVEQVRAASGPAVRA